MSKIDGQVLIGWGFTPGRWFSEALRLVNDYYQDYPTATVETLRAIVAGLEPEPAQTIPYRDTGMPFRSFLDAQTPEERANEQSVMRDMEALMRVPTVVSGAVMPDACPAGVIPVGGVVATKDAIHPGFHSADVCCSMAISVFDKPTDLKRLLDIAQSVTHFGPGGRNSDRWAMSSALEQRFRGNKFLRDLVEVGHHHMGTQGDGNHFFFVGTLRSTGQPAIVTHHGSRGVGARLFKRGMAIAKEHTRIISPETPSQAAWIDANSEDGIAYWHALQAVRQWTRENHEYLHWKTALRSGNAVVDTFWNEHNFVFRRDDGLYYHAKGATPSYHGFADDTDGRTLIPMNMSEPILITQPASNDVALGFAPHGAGRNMSRTQWTKNLAALYGDSRGLSPRSVQEIIRNQAPNVDARFYLGTPDVSELPGAYKNAQSVVRSIETDNLAIITDYVDPYGSIMAGEMNWSRKKDT